MSQEQAKTAYRLAGICKKCHKVGFGYLLYGVGPFICYQCAGQQTAQPTSSMSFTFTNTTSTSSTTNTDYTGNNSK